MPTIYGFKNSLAVTVLPIYSRRVLPNRWTPRTLAARIFTLLRDRPILLLPVLIADVLAFTANTLQRAITRWLVTLVIYSHASVLSPNARTINPSSASMMKAALITAPCLWLFYLLSTYLYTLALVSTSALLQQTDVLTTLQQRRKPILWFTFRFWLLLIPAVIVAGYLMSLLLGPLTQIGLTGYKAGVIIGVLIGIAIAFVTIPAALKLLTNSEESLPQPQIRLARFAAFAILILQFAIPFAIPHLVALFPGLFQQSSSVGVFLREGVTSLVGAIPYALLFIALSVLAHPRPSHTVEDLLDAD